MKKSRNRRPVYTVRRGQVARLLRSYGLQRGTQARIARELNVSQATISRDAEHLRNQTRRI